jgi:glycerol-3-phosphate acyltransferase PlsY
MATYIIMAIIAYCIGSVNFSVLISRKMAGFDVREKGSGNAGSTNVLREVGIKAAVITLICDILKGVIAIFIALVIGKIVKDTDKALLVQLAGIFVILGHTFPIFFEFRGGKGVATALGILLISNWKIGLICLVFALVIMAISRMVSMGAIGAAILFPVLTLFINENFIVEASGLKYFIFSLILALIVIFNHRENLGRILNGTENKISFKKNE